MIYTDYIDSVRLGGSTLNFDPPMLVGVEVHTSNRKNEAPAWLTRLLDLVDQCGGAAPKLPNAAL